MIPNWLQITIAVFGLIGTILGIFGISAYVGERMKHKATRRNRREDADMQEIEELRHQKYMNDLRTIIKEENEQSTAPLKQELISMNTKLNILADGTTDILRERILSTYYKCLEKGYRTQYDSENLEHMHKDYIGLGGNSFIADCVKEIKALPTEVEYKARKKAMKRPQKPKKQLLLENK